MAGYNTKVHHVQGGDEIVVEDGGRITVKAGGKLVINGIEFPTTLGAAGQVLTVNAGATGIEWANIPA